jgi:hypothetical protein
VAGAAIELRALGKKPTYQAIRDRIGSGSLRTIAKLLRDMEENGVPVHMRKFAARFSGDTLIDPTAIPAMLVQAQTEAESVKRRGVETLEALMQEAQEQVMTLGALDHAVSLVDQEISERITLLQQENAARRAIVDAKRRELIALQATLDELRAATDGDEPTR